MAGSTFLRGEQKIRPAVYVRVTAAGEPPATAVPRGIVAALFRASWGPAGEAVHLESADAVKDTYGSGGTVEVAEEAFYGGCRRVLAYRLGSDGAAATLTVQDTDAVPVDVVQLDAKYPGTRGNDLKVTLRTSLSDENKKELVVYEGTTLRETLTFDAGAGEVDNLVAAVNAGSDWLVATKIADGNGTLEDVAQEALAGGTDPTVTATDYDSALSAIEALDWNVLAVDSEDVAVHAAVQTYVDRVRGEGKRVLVVLGEPTSVDLATRLADAAAFNDPAVIYVANGFEGSDGITREGYRAAARVAGMVAGAEVTDSLTHAVVSGATELVGALTNAQVEQAITSGALVFTRNANKQVQIEYGINTLVTPSADQDAGWKKIRRVRTRDDLMDRIVAVTDPLIGKVNNSPDGRATLIAAMQGVVNSMVREGALLGGTVTEDPSNPPAGDSAWFLVQVDDLDSTEKVYLTFGFRFAPPEAA